MRLSRLSSRPIHSSGLPSPLAAAFQRVSRRAYPMIPITLSIVGGAQTTSRRHRIGLVLVYVVELAPPTQRSMSGEYVFDAADAAVKAFMAPHTSSIVIIDSFSNVMGWSRQISRQFEPKTRIDPART